MNAPEPQTQRRQLHPEPPGESFQIQTAWLFRDKATGEEKLFQRNFSLALCWMLNCEEKKMIKNGEITNMSSQIKKELKN